MSKVIITTTISPEDYKFCKEQNLKMSQLLTEAVAQKKEELGLDSDDIAAERKKRVNRFKKYVIYNIYFRVIYIIYV